MFISNKKFEIIFASNSILNKPGFNTVAACSYKINVTDLSAVPKEKVNEFWVADDMTLTISGCSRTVDLDLDFSTEEEMANSLYKLQKLKQIIEEAEVDLKSARKIYLNSRRIKKLNEEIK